MSAFMVFGLVVLLSVAAAAGWFLRARRGGAVRSAPEQAALPVVRESVQHIEPPPEPEPVPEVRFGEDPERPVVTISALVEDERFVHAEPVSRASGVVAMVDSLLQAAPPIGVAAAHHGRRLMEVSIAGEMMKAADGNGLRAMARGPDGKFLEHGRLYGTEGLKKAVSAAAVWQVASVVVAQKHMADITEKLQEIAEGVQRTNQFLDKKRLSVITGTYDYLRELAQTIQKGELPESGWNMLEPKEVELREVRDHLSDEFQSSVQPAADPDSFGTEGLSKNIQKKYERLQNLVHDMELCLKTRLLACFVRSLYPRESGLTHSRLGNLLDEARQLERLKAAVVQDCRTELERITSSWNLESTLEGRRKMVGQTSIALEKTIEASMARSALWGSSMQKLMLQRDAPTRLLVEVVDGKVGQVRLAQQAVA